MPQPFSRKALRRQHLARSGRSSAEPARLVLLVLLAAALLGGCGLVVTLAVHATAVNASPAAHSARSLLQLGKSTQDGVRARFGNAPNRSSAAAAAAAGAGADSGLPVNRAQAVSPSQTARSAPAAAEQPGAAAAAAGHRPDLPLNTAQADMQPQTARAGESEAVADALPGLPTNRAEALAKPLVTSSQGQPFSAVRPAVPDSHLRPAGRARATAKRLAREQAVSAAEAATVAAEGAEILRSKKSRAAAAGAAASAAGSGLLMSATTQRRVAAKEVGGQRGRGTQGTATAGDPAASRSGGPERLAAAAVAGGPGGSRSRGRQRRGGAYVALCAIMKDQNAEVREWVEHHAGLGVGKIYITDSGSAVPLGREIRDYIASGLVDYFYSDNLAETTEFPQLYVYDVCLDKFGGRHEWMGFIDADEFLVLNGSEPSLPALLRGYEDFAALGVNMRTFGSSGHETRPEGSTLHNYVKCTDGDDLHTRHIKTIAHTRGGRVLQSLTPHSFEFEDGSFAVNERREPIEDYLTDEASWEHVVLNHYVLKSREEFAAKVARSNGMNDPKPTSFFDEIDALATEDCTYAAELYPVLED